IDEDQKAGVDPRGVLRLDLRIADHIYAEVGKFHIHPKMSGSRPGAPHGASGAISGAIPGRRFLEVPLWNTTGPRSARSDGSTRTRLEEGSPESREVINGRTEDQTRQARRRCP